MLANIPSKVAFWKWICWKKNYFSWKHSFDHGAAADESQYPFPGGVTHSDELLYLFPYPPENADLNEEDTQMAQLMVDLWTSFAISGVPYPLRRHDEINTVDWKPFSGCLKILSKILNHIIHFVASRIHRSSLSISGPFGSYLHIDKQLRTDNDYRREFTIEVQDQQCRIMN